MPHAIHPQLRSSEWPATAGTYQPITITFSPLIAKWTGKIDVKSATAFPKTKTTTFRLEIDVIANGRLSRNQHVVERVRDIIDRAEPSVEVDIDDLEDFEKSDSDRLTK